MLFFNMIIGITMIDKTDTGFLNMTPSNAISRSVPKGHVRHLNDLVPVSWGKPFWVKPAIDRIVKSSLSRYGSFSQESEPKKTLYPLPRVLPKSRVVMQTPNSG